MRNIKRGDTLYILLYSRSKSGLSRFYRVFIPRDGGITEITYLLRGIVRLSESGNRPLCVEMRGGGYDGAQDIAHQVSQYLFDMVGALKYEKL